jgi:hypothetical protein
MNSTKFLMTRDIAGYNGFGIPFTNVAKSALLATGVEQHFTVPSDYPYWIAIFGFMPGSSVWVANNDTAAAPSGAFSDSTSELNPAARYVKGGDVLSFITADVTSAEINVLLYVAPPYGN